jgi:hypothetical protein
MVRILHVYFPRGGRIKVRVGGVAAPEALDEQRRRRDLAVEMFLPLLLLHLQGEA